MLSAPAVNAAQAEAHNAPESLAEDGATHFGGAGSTVAEYYGEFLDAEAESPSRIFHLDLEAVAYHLDLVEVHFAQHLGLVAHKACGGVVDRHTGNHSHIERCSVGDEDA